MSPLAFGVLMTLASLPSVVCLFFVWWMDKYDREQPSVVFAVFLGGAVLSILLAIQGQTTFSQIAHAHAWVLTNPADYTRVSTIISGPAIEELAKLVVLLPLLAYREFDNMTDGFVYGAAVGFGFAATENYIYLNHIQPDSATFVSTFIVRATYCSLSHAVYTAIVGASLGFGRYRRPTHALASLGIGLGLATTAHALWNALVLATLIHQKTHLFWLDALIFPVLAATVFVVFRLCVYNETRVLYRELHLEATRGTLPSQYVTHLSRWEGRTHTDWLPPSIPRDAFIRTATRLGMRRHQRELLGNRAQDHIEEDIQALRAQLLELWKPESPHAQS